MSLCVYLASVWFYLDMLRQKKLETTTKKKYAQNSIDLCDEPKIQWIIMCANWIETIAFGWKTLTENVTLNHGPINIQMAFSSIDVDDLLTISECVVDKVHSWGTINDLSQNIIKVLVFFF